MFNYSLVVPEPSPHFQAFCEFTPTPEHKTQPATETSNHLRAKPLSKPFAELNELAKLLNKKRSSLNKNELTNTKDFELRLNSALEGLRLDHENSYEDFKNLRTNKKILGALLRHENVALKSGKLLKDVINPFYQQITQHKNQLLQSEKIAAHLLLDKMKAKKEGQRILNYTFTTSQMHSLLHGTLLGAHVKDLWNISKALCQEINQIMDDPDKYKGKNLQLSAFQNNYYFFDFENEITEEHWLDFRFWLEVSPDGKSVDLTIDPPNQNDLAQGTYKKVRRLLRYTFEFKLEKDTSTQIYKRKATYAPLVLQEGISEYSESLMKKGILFQKQMQSLAPLAKFPAEVHQPAPLIPGTTSFSKYPLSYQKYYNGDLGNANENKTVPLDFGKNPKTVPLTFKDILNVFLDVSTTLNYFHQQYVVHRDIKQANILLEIKEDRIHGYPADYDLSELAGPNGCPESFVSYWDELSHRGFVTPFTDVFGLALCLYESAIDKLIRQNPYQLLDEKGFELLFRDVIKDFFKKNLTGTALEALAKDRKQTSSSLQKALNDSLTTSAGFDKKRFRTTKAEIDAIQKILIFVRDVMRGNEQIKAYTVNRTLLFVELKKNKQPVKQSEVHLDSDKIQQNIKVRQSALKFLESINHENAEENEKHPLFIALSNPIQMNSTELIETVINQEVDLLIVLPNLKELIGPLNFFEKYTDPKLRREALKDLLKNLINSSLEPHLKSACRQYLTNISIIEETMLFIIQLRDEYRECIKKVMADTVSMETFVATIRAIRQDFLLSTESEEKN